MYKKDAFEVEFVVALTVTMLPRRRSVLVVVVHETSTAMHGTEAAVQSFMVNATYLIEILGRSKQRIALSTNPQFWLIPNRLRQKRRVRAPIRRLDWGRSQHQARSTYNGSGNKVASSDPVS
jgi:hypothetical protein